MLRFAFYPRPLGGRRHQGISQKSNRVSDFYPRPPGGGRPNLFILISSVCLFLSTPSGWRATCPRYDPVQRANISIHALRVEGDYMEYIKNIINTISIHALRVEGDSSTPEITAAGKIFLSTPSGWRATLQVFPDCLADFISIHALRVEGDRELRDKTALVIISIHALRVEGDSWPGYCYRQKRAFLSTPSGWRATPPAFGMSSESRISIHALRVEGDPESWQREAAQNNFYPRPPGGGRPSKEP